MIGNKTGRFTFKTPQSEHSCPITEFQICQHVFFQLGSTNISETCSFKPSVSELIWLKFSPELCSIADSGPNLLVGLLPEVVRAWLLVRTDGSNVQCAALLLDFVSKVYQNWILEITAYYTATDYDYSQRRLAQLQTIRLSHLPPPKLSPQISTVSMTRPDRG